MTPFNDYRTKRSESTDSSAYSSTTGLLSNIPLDELMEYTKFPQRVAAQKLNVSISTLKRSFQRRFKAMGKTFRWPYHGRRKPGLSKNRGRTGSYSPRSSESELESMDGDMDERMEIHFLTLDSNVPEKKIDAETSRVLYKLFRKQKIV